MLFTCLKNTHNQVLNHVFVAVKLICSVNAMVRGYHVYQEVWKVCVGEIPLSHKVISIG